LIRELAELLPQCAGESNDLNVYKLELRAVKDGCYREWGVTLELRLCVIK